MGRKQWVMRMRYLDSAGDFGRTKRQRQVIQAIIDRGASVASVPKLNIMIDVLGNNMETNMDFDDMKNLLLNYKDVRNNTVSYMMKGNGTKIGGIYYLIVPDEEVEKVHGMIAEVKSKRMQLSYTGLWGCVGPGIELIVGMLGAKRELLKNQEFWD